MKRLLSALILCLMLSSQLFAQVVGANRTELYFDSLRHHRVGVVANPTSVIFTSDSTWVHLVDSLVASGIEVRTIFCPEHGFRGQAEAGAHISSGKDEKTGLPIVSLYGKNKKPTPEQLRGLDYVVFDLQDVGCRFYTYISTLHYVMEACAENGVKLLVLDRPNPNGHYVDGPVLNPKFKSFVGMHPVPVVHGMTIGEYAMMVNGEGWLANGVKCRLTVVRMESYIHQTPYVLPIAPSPNLQTAQAVALYPSLCLFEGTNVSVGRGTAHPFELVGSPSYAPPAGAFSFKPKPIPGVSENPPFNGKICYGLDLRKAKVDAKFDLRYLLEMYRYCPKEAFFLKSDFFEKLAGTDDLRHQLVSGASEAEIRQSWEPALTEYKAMRKKYLLYDD